MGSHRTTIRRKKPLTHLTTAPHPINRKQAIQNLHTTLKSTSRASPSSPAIPLSVYQHASSQGQAQHRGGDSSKVLVQWLKSHRTHDLRVLEIGCLEVDNAIAKVVEGKGGGSIRRIDLKSRDPRIEEQDFMTMEVPSEGYDLISLSLVLNFVGSPQGRYDMLNRTTLFLRKESGEGIFPALFVVLPLPCVENSRYLTMEHFLAIMASLGYELKESKQSKRMAYWLFQWTGSMNETTWRKKIIRDGGKRNNFAICNI